MSSKAFVLETMRRQARVSALSLQEQATSMEATELNAESGCIPSFLAAKARRNMHSRPVGFLCKSSTGRVTKLLQPYDSDVYPQEPEALPAQWGVLWSQDPAHALPFISLSTSPYMTGDCCSENGIPYRSAVDHNVWAPSAYPAGWIQVHT